MRPDHHQAGQRTVRVYPSCFLAPADCPEFESEIPERSVACGWESEVGIPSWSSADCAKLPEHQGNFLLEYSAACQRVENEEKHREQEARKLRDHYSAAHKSRCVAQESAAAERTRARESYERTYDATADLVQKLLSQVLEQTRPKRRVQIESLSPTQRLARLRDCPDRAPVADAKMVKEQELPDGGSFWDSHDESPLDFDFRASWRDPEARTASSTRADSEEVLGRRFEGDFEKRQAAWGAWERRQQQIWARKQPEAPTTATTTTTTTTTTKWPEEVKLKQRSTAPAKLVRLPGDTTTDDGSSGEGSEEDSSEHSVLGRP